MSEKTEIIKQGLIFHLEPFNTKCFTPSTDGEEENLFLNNLADDGSTKARLYPGKNGFEYDHKKGAIKVKNISSDTKQNNSCLLFPPISNIRTFSIWIYFDNLEQSASTRYLLSSEFDGYAIYDSSPPGILGNQWYDSTNMTFLENGNVVKDLTWSNIETQRVWKNITFRIGNYSIPQSSTQVEVADSYSDPSIVVQNLTLFASFMKENGLNCHFGPVMIYDRILTPDENFQNYIYYSQNFIQKDFSPHSSPFLSGSTSVSSFVLDLMDNITSTFSSTTSTSTYTSTIQKKKSKKLSTLFIILAIVLPIIVSVAGVAIAAYYYNKKEKE